MIRTGTFRYVRIERLPEFLARGWMPVAELGRVHGSWSVLCWRCECPEIADAVRLVDCSRRLTPHI
jgi:hypothetical protein